MFTFLATVFEGSCRIRQNRRRVPAAGVAVKRVRGGAQADTAVNVASKIVSYFNEKGGDVSKATVTTDTAANTFKVSDGTTCVECDASGNCSDCSER